VLRKYPCSIPQSILCRLNLEKPCPYLEQFLVDLLPKPKCHSFYKMHRISFSLFLAIGTVKFMDQDRIIMQAQDRRKMMNEKWEDLYHTKADTGVKAMQKWARTFGRPSFEMPGLQEGRQMSVWDRQAKYGPKCHRSISLVATFGKKGTMISNVSFWSSLAGIFVSTIWKKASGLLIKSALGLLLLSVGMRYLSSACSTILERVFVNPANLPKYQMMETYTR
jgi:hypothetical protein